MTPDLLAALRDPATIRLRCAAVTRAVDEGRSGLFTVDRSKLDDAAGRVADLTRRRFPDLQIPLHSRWRHFEAGGVDRKAELDRLLEGRSAGERVRALFDLTVISVLLDAGAGAQWHYHETRGALDAAALPAGRAARDELMAMLDKAAQGRTKGADGARGGGSGAAGDHQAAATPPAANAPDPDTPAYTRSEGLAVASFRAFVGGAFSSAKDDPLRVDAAALRSIDAAALRSVFQVNPGNPLVGLEGRAALLARLGDALAAEAARDGTPPRPALVYERITDRGTRREVGAAALLGELLRSFAPIWASGTLVKGQRAGDVWPHRWAGADTPDGTDITTGGLVPFHKLTQWLAYSLAEPLQWAGVRLGGLEQLTGLPEYRNGGLLIDTGVIVPRQPQLLDRGAKPGDELVVEWRALTVTLLDELAARVRTQLGRPDLPLACVLEGGTWAAGREIARERRAGGGPPLKIDSDATVF
jgi:hypothetical protein